MHYRTMAGCDQQWEGYIGVRNSRKRHRDSQTLRRMTSPFAPEGKPLPLNRLTSLAIDIAIGSGAVVLFAALAYLLQGIVRHDWEMSPPLFEWLGAGFGLVLGLFLIHQRRFGHLSGAESRRVEESEARLAGIIRSSMEAIITVDSEQRVILFNPMAEKLFAWPAENAIGRPLGDFIPERFRPAHEEHVRRFGVTGVSDREMGRQRALYALRRDGSEFPIEASISQIADRGTRLYTVMLRDITERVRAEEAMRHSREELQHLSDSILATREEEKRRIARELHDDLGQRLSALKMDLAMLGADLKEKRSLQCLLEEVAAMNVVIDETVASVRRIASDLRPALLDELGMLPAIEWLANDCATRYGLTVTVDGVDADVSEQVAIAMFRIVQEALSNVVRHANATAVHIHVARAQDQLELQVQDNGVGWDKLSANDEPRKSLGLLGIRERARLLGGTVAVDSAPGEGFCLAVKIPYEGKAFE
ncbi:PAS domain S-box protein [Cupriavidus oxalaticus]|uniref:PAS domain-containing sensor histidine kinase n=1 Tax=Cupriavidus oxalaticus TaxID=96344 RepID=UPI003F73373A